MRDTSNFKKFNVSQRQALDARRNLAVRANAGSGKTSVLLERIVQLLARGWDAASRERQRPEDERGPAGPRLEIGALAAVTFTRKAAAQLRDGLRLAFQVMAQQAGDRGERDFWKGQIDHLPRAAIGTIDSLCARILREHGLKGGPDAIEPDFELLTDHDHDVCRAEAVERLINRLGAMRPGQGHPCGPLQEDLQWWAKEEGYATLTRHLKSLLGDLVEPADIADAHRDGRPYAERVDEAWSRLPAVRRLQQGRTKLTADLEQLKGRLLDSEKSNETLRQLRAGIDDVLGWLSQVDRANDQKVLTWLRSSFFNQDGTATRKPGLKSVLDLVLPIQEAWSCVVPDHDFDFAGEARALEAADRLARLLLPAHDEYLRRCRETGRYDFLTVARRARNLLAQAREVREDMRQRYRYVFVDEFQDTNQLQWDIISYLVGDGADGRLDRDRLFIVGDPQQSIYRFRQADVSVFHRIQEHIRSSNQHHGSDQAATDYDEFQARKGNPPCSDADQRQGIMPLRENYRSLHPLPLLLVNRVMQHVFGKAVADRHNVPPPFEVQYQELEPGLTNAEVGEVRYVVPGPLEKKPGRSQAEPGNEAEAGTGVRPANGDRDAEETPLSQLQVQCVVDQLIHLRGQPKYVTEGNEPGTLRFGDMAILLPSRDVVLNNLEKELTRRHVPYIVTKGVGFWQRQEIRDVVSLASWLADQGDGLSLFAVLRSPLLRLTDTQAFFLSELGRADLWRGLRFLSRVDDRLLPLKTLNDQDRRWVEDHWGKFPAELATVLTETWRASRREPDVLRQAHQLLSGWRRRVDRTAHADLLQRALEESAALAVYGAESGGELIVSNLRRLFHHIRDEEGRSAPGLARLARWLRDQVEGSLKQEQATLPSERDAVRIMTVHAAKGLEFPVVAVMKMERRINRFRNTSLLVKNRHDDLLPGDREAFPDLAPGTLAVSVRHPDRPRETYTPQLLRALRSLEQAQEVAESRRLFYVAATRAKERLILAGTEGKNQESWQTWMEEALDIQARHKEQGFWEDSSLKMTIITKPEDMPPLDVPPPEELHEDIVLSTIRESPKEPMQPTTLLEDMLQDWRRDRRHWWLAHRLQVAPHVPELPARFPEEGPESFTEKIGTSVGTLAHRLFEMEAEALSQPASARRELLETMAINLLATSPTEDGPTDETGAPAVVDAAAARVVEGVEAVLKRVGGADSGARAVRKLLEADGEAEVDFALQVGRWHISGRFDKLIRRGTGFEIVDWKTDAGLSPAEIAERHGPQMRLYALALYRTGQHFLVEGSIRVHLAMLHFPRVETLCFTPDKLAQHARELERELGEVDAFEPEWKAAW